MDMAKPLKTKINITNHETVYSFRMYLIYLYSVGKSSTPMQNIRPTPVLEKASNIEDSTRFSIEDVIKYKRAAETPDPTKFSTRQKNSSFIILNVIVKK